MARWYLTAAHYLKVPGTEWEYKETDRMTGKQKRKVFPVPLYLNPADDSDCNFRHGIPGVTDEPMIVVASVGRGLPGDIEFEGPPTPDMEPLDDEAREISAQWAPQWVHPIEDLPGQGGMSYSQSILSDLEAQVASAATKFMGPTQAAQSNELAELRATNKLLQDQMNTLLAAMAGSAAKQPIERRV
jgi:hypothetical protein